VVGIWCLPVSGLIRTEHIIIVAKQLLTARDILKRDASRIPQRVVKHHEGGRPSESRFTVKMRPTILWKRTDRENKSIDFVIKGPAMIRYGDAHISRVTRLNKLTFRAGMLDGHILCGTRSDTRFFYRSARSDNDFTPGFKRFHPCTLICFNCVLTATDIHPVACSVPANGQSIDKYVRLLPQIEDGHRAARARQQKLEAISCKLAAARSMKIGQAGV